MVEALVVREEREMREEEAEGSRRRLGRCEADRDDDECEAGR